MLNKNYRDTLSKKNKNIGDKKVLELVSKKQYT